MIGHVLDGRYRLDRVIGEGGMGIVYSARHVELGETVAVKVLNLDGADPKLVEEHLERFLREARLAAKLKSEHVVKVLDVARGKDGAPPYIAMELLDGKDLSAFVGSLGVADAVDYVLQACEGLAEAHALGIVHRDLKSSNLFVTHRADGSPLVKILDFGISKMHDEAGGPSKLTTTRAVFGSPAYMSPEQIRSAKYVDQRTDVWAMAVVLYETLAGQMPFFGANATAVLAAIAADEPTPLGRYLPSAPSGLDAAIRAALEKRRDARTPSIAAFAEAIAPFGGATSFASLSSVRRLTGASAPQWGDISGIRSAAPPRPSDDALAVTAAAPVEPEARVSPVTLAVVASLVASIATAGALAAYFTMRTPEPKTVTATAPPAASAAASVAPVAIEVVDAPAPSAQTVHASTRPPRGRPHPPPPAATAKPNGSIDTSARY